MGANAVVGVDIDYEVLGQGSNMNDKELNRFNFIILDIPQLFDIKLLRWSAVKK